MDHIVPLSNGGTDDYDNLRPLCHACHAVKSRADMGHKARIEFDADGMPADDHAWTGDKKSSAFQRIPASVTKNTANRKSEETFHVR